MSHQSTALSEAERMAAQENFQRHLERAKSMDLNAVRRRIEAERRDTVCKPDCPICGGIGWVRHDTISTSDVEFGKLFPCPNLNVLEKSSPERIGISEVEKSLNWQRVEMNLALRQAQFAITKTLERGSGWVYMHGKYGLAKSLCLKIAVNEALKMQKEAAYVRMANFVDKLRMAFDSENPNHELQDRLDYWTDLPVLALDEVEKVSLTDFAREKMFLLFDKRYEDAKAGKSITLMASNMAPAGLDGYLADRIRDKAFSVIEVAGDSYRSSAPNDVP